MSQLYFEFQMISIRAAYEGAYLGDVAGERKYRANGASPHPRRAARDRDRKPPELVWEFDEARQRLDKCCTA